MKTHKPNSDHKILHPLVITINLMLILFLGNAFSVGYVSNAQETGDTGTVLTAPPPLPVEGNKTAVNNLAANICVYELTKFADPEYASYTDFMEKNFLNKAKTNDLLELGMKRYEKFKADIWGMYQLLIYQNIQSASQSGASNASLFPGLAACEAKAAEYVNNAGKMLEMRAVSTSNIKQATLFVEKYKQINGKLRSLNMDVMQMVTNISTFEQKLPCYLKSCI